jgi:hypothetical protein
VASSARKPHGIIKLDITYKQNLPVKFQDALRLSASMTINFFSRPIDFFNFYISHFLYRPTRQYEKHWQKVTTALLVNLSVFIQNLMFSFTATFVHLRSAQLTLVGLDIDLGGLNSFFSTSTLHKRQQNKFGSSLLYISISNLRFSCSFANHAI